MMRIIVTLTGLFLCLLGVVSSGKSGLARFLSTRAVAENHLHFANDAVSLEPSDPESHLSRGLVFMSTGNFVSAIESFEMAVTLRPEDHSIWVRLGHACDMKGDTTGALTAFTEAVRLAPYYAQPHWQLGNTLLKAQQKEAAFVELSRAAHSDPLMLSDVIELVWLASGKNATEVLRVIDPKTDLERISLARFFVKQGSMSEGLDLLRKVGSVADLERHQLVIQLIEARRFKDASDVWKTGNDAGDDALLVDGGFERGIIIDTTGFVWQVMRSAGGVKVAVDRRNARSGASCLSIDFDGIADSDVQFVQQLVLLETNARYRLTFAARGKQIASGGLPLVAIIDAGESAQMLATSQPIPAGTSDWSNYSLEFVATSQTEAAYIIIRRQKCQDGLCPIFGHIWLDDFSLIKL